MSRHGSIARWSTRVAITLLAVPLTLGCSEDDGPRPDVGPADVGVVDAPERFDTPPDLGPEVPLRWAALAAGSFTMGSSQAEICRTYDEVQHGVTLTHAFELSTTEVTQAQFYRLRGYNPSIYDLCGSQCPVENINWHEAAAFCNALSDKSSLDRCYQCQGEGMAVRCQPAPSYTGANIYACAGYRLPTEAEWEYAYRAGTTTSYYNGEILRCVDARNEADYPDPEDDPQLDKAAWAMAWYDSNTSGQLQLVGQKMPNGWGLYDMSGNVWEWCNDWRAPYPTTAVSDPAGPNTGEYRILRGGAADSATMYIRGAYRFLHSPEYRDGYTGFRVARTR